MKPLFDTKARGNARYAYDVTPDGQRFLVNVVREEASIEPLTLAVNWTAALQQ